MTTNCIEKGIITYIYLENFVTYTKVAVKPGRNLNVIIGPNGTGKSTIVCAIVLGLGGKTSTIGRAIHVADYIKAGCSEAKIEIHLTNGLKSDTIVTRVFNSQGKNSWLLNGKACKVKDIEDLTKSLDIQVDNLCQFLPQDKVQDFSKMNAQELLENTERSVGDPIVLKHHKQLIEYRINHGDLEKQIVSKKKLLQSKIQVYEGLKETVSGIKERKMIKRKIVHLKQKKAWLLYDQKRKHLIKIKNKKDDAVKKATSIEEEIKPINDSIEKLKSEMKILQNKATDHGNKIKMKTGKLKNMLDNILDCENNIKDCENNYKQRVQAEEARDSDIKAARQQKSKLDNDLTVMMEDIGSEETLTRQKHEISSKINEQRNVITMLTNKSSTLMREEDMMKSQIRAQEDELKFLNIETKRLQLLREKHSDAYKAVLWLKGNRDKFSATIHDPILLSINVKDASYAKYLENIIPFRDLVAFVCENKRDMNSLLQYLRDEQKLQVNVVYSDPMKNVSMTPRNPLENIKQFGFTHYLVSLIEAPTTIMKYLVSMYNLSNIPVGTNTVDDRIDHIPHNINCYFSRNNMYMVNRSKYTGDKSTSMQSVSSSNMLSLVLDKAKLMNIEETLRLLKEKKANATTKVQQIEEEISEQNKKLDQYRAERHKCQQDLQQIQTLKSRISMVEKKLINLENERTSIEKIKESNTKDIKVLLNKQTNLYKTYNTEMEQCFESTITNEQIGLALKLQNRSLRIKTNNSQDLREELKVAQEVVKKYSSDMLLLKSEVQGVYNEALNSTDGLSPSDKGFEALNKIFNKLPPTIEEINNELNIAQAKVFCMGNNVDGENVLREYEEIEREIGHLKDSIQAKTQELEVTAQQMETLRVQWLEPLSKTVEKINSNFSSYFSAMGCAGEVILEHGENAMDFAQYGLKIKVKFRDTDQLQELTRHHQSGGERALTTAIYMISLQELSRVPFRCVDEINQGMDAVNERRVFNLLVKMTSRLNSSQYFLLTPKLLPDLQYSESVTVHCVFNGPSMINHKEFDTEKYCKHVVKMMEKENSNDD